MKSLQGLMNWLLNWPENDDGLILFLNKYTIISYFFYSEILIIVKKKAVINKDKNTNKEITETR